MAGRVPLVEFDTLDANLRLWFLAIFHADIRQAQLFVSDALTLARQGQDDQNPDSWYCRSHDAAIVRYARCFLACRLPDGKANTRLPDRYRIDGPLKVIHDRTMKLRHVIVAHADLRERHFTLTKVYEDDAKAGRWNLATSGGNFPPQALTIFASLCEIHRKMLVREMVPMIESRLSTMDVGETITLASNRGGEMYWLHNST